MIGTSLDYLNIHLGFGGKKSVQFSKYSLDRYVVTVDAIHNGLESVSIQNAFELLNLSKYEDTQWQIIYDLEAKCIQWRTKNNHIIKKLLLTDFYLKKECITIEMDTMEQNIYAKSRNLMLVNSFFKGNVLFEKMKISDLDIETLASNPERV
jgi:hypothetical protein